MMVQSVLDIISSVILIIISPSVFAENTCVMSGGYRAVVFGGSGNVGKQLVATLFANAPETYAKITLISRRPLPEYDDIEKYKGVISVRVVPDMNAVGSEDLSGHDAAFMLLGA